MGPKPRILIAPLNWGLGHATRCIPLIRHLIRAGCQVVIAGNGISGRVLKIEFPELEYLELPDFSIKYSRSGSLVKWKILFQLANLLTNIKKERNYLNVLLAENRFDALISDNRFGFSHPSVPSVFITHQLRIISPFGRLSTWLLEQIQRSWINRFTECWVPDFKNEPDLSGNLSHPKRLPAIPVRYLGPLSRLERKELSEDIDCLISLSGPEPQRTILENLLVKEAADLQMVSLKMKVVLVRGLPAEDGYKTEDARKKEDGYKKEDGHKREEDHNKEEAQKQHAKFGSMEVYDYANAALLNQLVNRAKLVIARSGYTTVMDLLKLRKRAIFIPTPGQTEQEYLADHLSQNHLACCFPQKNFSLVEAIETAEKFPYQFPFRAEDMELYKNEVEEFVRSLRKTAEAK